MNVTLLAIAGGAIILGLASYAGYLLLQTQEAKGIAIAATSSSQLKSVMPISYESVNILVPRGYPRASVTYA